MNVGQLTASLSLNIGSFVNNMKQAVRHVQGLSSSMNNALGAGAQGNINGTKRHVDALSGSFKDLDRIVSGILISQIFYQSVAAIKDGIGAVAHFSNEMAKAQISFEYFLGTAERAEGFILNMQDFAASTAFSTEQALTLSRRLMGAKFKPEQIRGIMETLNDANAVTGATAEQMDRIVLAMTQMKTNGKIAGQELRQFAEAGIPIYQILQEELGLTADQMANIGDLKISGDLGVAAILKGLERYKGAAHRIADTVPGMMETIRDNLLMIGKDMFKPIYKSIEGILTYWRDSLDSMRKELVQHGLGGVFEKFIPKELQQSLRQIIGSFQSLWGSLKMIGAALKPVVEMLVGAFVKALGLILPPIAALIRLTAQLIAAVMNANPWVQALAATIAGLIVANAAAKALMFLWTVTGMGMLSGVVAGAVATLGRAIQGLLFVLTRNPLAAAILLAAGAMVYLISTSKTATEWLDQMKARLMQFTGIDFGSILKPEDGKSLAEWTDQFNQGLDDMQKNLKDVGKEAKKTGKEVKDKFVASFDELYQIPDQLDKAGDGLADIGDLAGSMPSLPSMQLPGLDFKLPAMPSLPSLDDLFPAIPKPGSKPPTGGTRPTKPPEIPPPDASPVTNFVTTINGLLDALKKRLDETAKGLGGWGEAIITTLVPALVPIKAVGTALVTMSPLIDTLIDDISKWGQAIVTTLTPALGTINDVGLTVGSLIPVFDTATKTVQDWVNTTGQAIDGWATKTTQAYTTWLKNTSQTVNTWSTDLRTTIGDWSQATWKDMSDWTVRTNVSFNTWASNVRTTVGTWVTETATAVTGWSTQTAQTFSQWYIDTLKTMSTWTTTTSTGFTTWISNTSKNISTWATNTSTNIATWSTETIQNVSDWATKTSSSVSSWAGSTSKNIYDWGVNTGTNIATWVNSTIQGVGTWSSTTSNAFADWVSGTSGHISSWTSNVLSNFGAFANGASSAIGAWASGTWDTFGSWLSGTGSAVYNWANSTIDTIVSWAQSAWSTISSLAASVGASVGSGFQTVTKQISNAGAAIGAWTSKNKDWLIPVAIGAVVVGGAAATVLSGGAAAPALLPAMAALGAVAAFERGGIVDQDQLARIGEKNRREAVIPLENSSYMKPFSAAVASDLADMLGGGVNDLAGSNSTPDTRPLLYVGTLIADERSLKELYRKMEVIGMAEGQRKGL